jgi:hypothetical protein
MNSTARSGTPSVSIVEANVDELIDLLADDALDAPRRTALLRSFDAMPGQDGWRRCALALLEAQSWRRAMAATAETARMTKLVESPGNERRSALFRRLALAAVIAAFAAGILLGQGRWWQTTPARQVTQVESPAQRPSEAPSDAGLIAQRSASNPVPGDVRQPVLPDYVRRQLEREGYEVQGGGAKLIPVKLPDGRRVNVPVETLKYQYVGRRVQ